MLHRNARRLCSKQVFRYEFHRMIYALPTAKCAQSPDERAKVQRVIAERRLCGLANNTKWNELISAMRERTEWTPRYRFQCVDGPPSSWDGEWFYHLPFPMLSVEWLDMTFLMETVECRLPPRIHITDHSPWIERLLQKIGFEYKKGASTIRVFGYSPKNLHLFDQ